VSPKLQKVVVKPINLAVGIAAGAVAGLVFKQVWKLASGEDNAPDAHDEDRGLTEILIAAAVQGAIFAVVRAAAQRGGAVTAKRLTGSWPD
jgi:hypothetical protein